jgi:methionyl aminopeptidase
LDPSSEFVKVGNHYYKDIGAIIEDYGCVEPCGFSTVRNFCGHGIGSVFQISPTILHYRKKEPNGQVAAWHTFTIEPTICVYQSTALLICYNSCFTSSVATSLETRTH